MEGLRETDESESSRMASSAALKAAKKELRTLMKKKLSSLKPESIEAQSELYGQFSVSF